MFKRLGVAFPIVIEWMVVCQQIIAIVEADMRKIRRDPYELITRMVQPAIWLLIFGQAMEKVRAIPTGELSYLDYMAPGILAQSILIIAIFYGIGIIWEKDLGILQKVLVSPAPRACLVCGRALAAGIRSIPQVIIIYILSFFLGIDLRIDVLAWLGVLAMVLLGAAIFSSFSLIIASIVKKRERFMGIGQVLIMPLFFASNALYPTSIMPSWIRVVSYLNPLTYQVDALRSLMIEGEPSQFGLLTDFAVGGGVLCILIVLATRLYPRLLY